MVKVKRAQRVLSDARSALLMFDKNSIDVNFRLSVVLNITLDLPPYYRTKGIS